MSKHKANISNWTDFLNNRTDLIVFVLPILLYFLTIGHSYNLDDELVTRNHRLTSKGISAIPEIFKSPYYEDASGYRYEYRPVALSLYTLEHSLFKESPHISHFISIIMFGLLCFLIFKTLSLLIPNNQLPVFFITILFSIHPGLTEVVSSIKNREEIYAFLFAFGAWFVTLKYIDKSILGVVIVNFILFQLGILCKPTIFPLIIIIPISLILTKKSSLLNSLLIFTSTAISVLIWTQITLLYYKFLIVLAGIVIISIVKFLYSGSSKKLNLQYKVDSEYTAQAFTFEGIDLFFAFLIFLIFIISVFFKSTSLLISLFVLSSVYSFFKPNYIFLFNLTVISIYISLITTTIEPFIFTSLSVYYLAKNEPNRKYFQLILPISCFILYFLSKDPSFLLPLSFILFFTFNKFTKYTIAFFFIGILINLVTLILEFNSIQNVFIPISYICLYILFALFAIDKTKKFKIGFLAVLVLISTTIYFQINNSSNNTPKITNIESPKFSPENVNRPLLFVEYPFKSFNFDSEKIATSLEVSLRYITKSIIPYPLSFYYGYKEIEASDFKKPIPWIGLVVLLILFVLFLYFIRKHPFISLSLFIYITSIVIVSNPLIPMPGILADRFLLLPVFGVSMLLVFSLFKYFNLNSTKLGEIKSLPNIPRNFLLIIFSLFFVGTLVRANQWKDKITLFSNDIKHVPNSAQANNLLGLEYMSKAMEQPGSEIYFNYTKKAIEHFTKATEIYPDFFNPTYDIARVNLELKNYDEAIKYYYKALDIDSSFSQCFLSIGMIYEETGKMDSAVIAYKQALKYNKSDLTTFNNLSFILFRMKKFEESINVNREAIINHPQRYEPVLNIGKTYYNLGTMDSAKIYFEKARALNPEVPTFDAILNSGK